MKKILLADNDPKFLKERKEFLEGEGYQVYPAGTVAEARRLLEQGRVDLAVLDLRLENDNDERDLSGLTLARTVSPSIPKIIMTGFPTYQAVRDALGASADGLPPVVEFIAKKEGTETFLHAVRNALKIMNVWFRATQEGITTQLDEDYARARTEANIHYWICLGISLAGAMVVMLGTILALGGHQRTGIVSVVSGIVIELVNLLFFTRLDGAYRRVDRYHEELLQSKRLENLLSACGEFSDVTNKEQTIMQIIQITSKQWMNSVGARNSSLKPKLKSPGKAVKGAE
ncbi:MAG: TRADD-N-associated membrane domain-containing protein [Blastocatellia bacterium]